MWVKYGSALKDTGLATALGTSPLWLSTFNEYANALLVVCGIALAVARIWAILRKGE